MSERIKVGSRSIPLPGSRWMRVGLGIALVFFGLLGFLPILGFWMIPLGLVVLAVDFPVLRRLKRRIEVWWGKRRRARRQRNRKTA